MSKLTGVSCHALRVWERRYGYPVPHRSMSGHRRYSPEQVRALRRIAKLVREGQPIGELIAEFLAGRLEIDQADEAPVAVTDDGPVSRLVDHLVAGDLTAAEAAYQRLAHGQTPAELVTRVIEPALVDTGERWFRRECQVFQERSASGYLRRKLDHMIELAQRANPQPRHTALVGTVQGDRHEGGALIVGLLLELAGWRSIFMGVDLPIAEYRRAAETYRPDVMALSFVLSRNINKRFQELEQVRELPVFVGGRSILNYQGLARRHGLIPLPGPAVQALPQLFARFEDWRRRQAPDTGRGGAHAL